jgi:hypothetical protein
MSTTLPDSGVFFAGGGDAPSLCRLDRQLGATPFLVLGGVTRKKK